MKNGFWVKKEPKLVLNQLATGKMKKILMATFLAFSNLICNAQEHDLTQANSGYLLTERDSLFGRLTVDFESNTILIKEKNAVSNYSSEQIKKAVFFNEKGDLIKIVSGFWGNHDNAHLFESIVEGENPLLYREGLTFEKYASDEFPPFFTIIEGSIVSLGNKKEIFRLFENKESVTRFAKKQKLRVDITQDLITLFCFVNGIDPLGVSVAGDDL